MSVLAEDLDYGAWLLRRTPGLRWRPSSRWLSESQPKPLSRFFLSPPAYAAGSGSFLLGLPIAVVVPHPRVDEVFENGSAALVRLRLAPEVADPARGGFGLFPWRQREDVARRCQFRPDLCLVSGRGLK